MGIAERRYRQKEEIRGLILETAWKQIQDDGAQALSIRKVADAIEYSVPVIYTHFESKDALLREFVQRGFRLLTEQVAAARDRHMLPADQLEAMALAYWDFAAENVQYYKLMFGVGIPSCDMAREIQEIRAFGSVIGSVVHAAIMQGKHPDASVELKFQSYWSILHGIITIRMHDPGRKDGADLGLAILTDTVAGFIYALMG
jgi:AcrR family transcriptional regulator